VAAPGDVARAGAAVRAGMAFGALAVSGSYSCFSGDASAVLRLLVLLHLKGDLGESRARHSVGADDSDVRGRRSPSWRRRNCSLPCSHGIPPGESPALVYQTGGGGVSTSRPTCRRRRGGILPGIITKFSTLALR